MAPRVPKLYPSQLFYRQLVREDRVRLRIEEGEAQTPLTCHHDIIFQDPRYFNDYNLIRILSFVI